MGRVDWSWSLTEGYSNLVDGARVELQFREGPVDFDLDLSPAGLARRRRPVRLAFVLKKGAGGAFRGIRWRIKPESQITARILFPRSAFLGNFRVPPGHTAAQWDVEVEVLGSLALEPFQGFFYVEAGTRMKHSWVEVFRGIPPRESLEAAWKNFVDPLDPEHLGLVSARQVIRIVGVGRVRFEFAPEWGLRQGWVLPSTLVSPLVSVGGEFRAGSRLEVRLEQEGVYQVQLARQNEQVDLTVRRTRERTASQGISAGFGFTRTARVSPLGRLKPDLAGLLIDPLSAPLVRSVNRQISRSLVRRVEASFQVESARSRRHALLLKASWRKPDGNFRAQYAEILEGRIPEDRAGSRISGIFEKVRTRRLTIALHLFHWKPVGVTQEEREYSRTSLTPEGDVLVEESSVRERRRIGWDTVQFFRLLSSSPGGTASRHTTRWSYGRQGRLSLDSIRKLLRLALHAGIIGDYVLPAASPRPLQVELLLVTEFQPDGMDRVRDAGEEAVWRAVIRAFELAQPERYGEGSCRRDWIESSALRELVDRDPVQAHLAGHYPISGRSDFQRRQVVDSYRQVHTFLELMRSWRLGRVDDPARLLFRRNLDLPIFAVFHLLCPSGYRRSAARLSGDLDRTWGDADLLLEGN